MSLSGSPNFDNTFAGMGADFSSSLAPTPVSEPELIRVNHELARSLGFDPLMLESDEGVAVLAGNGLLEGMEPIAAVYAGHQFGQFNPQLGDGRAILLGEVIAKNGQRFDVQLKGSGPTPYSRGGDGRAPLGPVLREYIVSEAMAAMGIPTSRSLAAVTTGDLVYREEPLHGAVLTRVASSHIRIGSFQFFAAKSMTNELRQLADYVIQRHYPEAAQAPQPYIALLVGVIKKQAELIAKWQHVGFVHGVMNTDNVLLSGETIDYGPCAFLDTYKPDQVFSSIDRGSRYAFQNQPSIGHWNLMNLAQTLLPLIHDETDEAIKLAQGAVDQFPVFFEAAYKEGMNHKLGLKSDCKAGVKLGEAFLSLLASEQVDFTLAFRRLAELHGEHFSSVALEGRSTDKGAPDLESFGDSVVDLFDFPDAFSAWLEEWRLALHQPDWVEEDSAVIHQSNPVFVPRNHLIEEAILAGYQDDLSLFEHLLQRVTHPNVFDKNDHKYARPPQPNQVVQQTFCGT
jgi:uncharacterized protein YdiU (UPF0061 family)